jgi:hypothetical protein
MSGTDRNAPFPKSPQDRLAERKRQEVEILKHYAESGFQLIPLKARSKEPLEEGYYAKTYFVERLSGHNVGLMVQGDLVDIDLDWPEARVLFCKFLPPTNANFGRGDPISVTHTLYRATCEPVDFKLPKVQGAPKLDGDHADTVLQLRTSRHGKPYHVMIPPSVHPNGDELEWIIMTRGQPDVLPTVVDGDDLRERTGVLAAACFLLRFYPPQGSRDDFALALTGALLRGGWNAEAVQDFVRLIAAMAGDEEADKRASKARRSKARLDAGRAVYGLSAGC